MDCNICVLSGYLIMADIVIVNRVKKSSMAAAESANLATFWGRLAFPCKPFLIYIKTDNECINVFLIFIVKFKIKIHFSLIEMLLTKLGGMRL